MPFISKPLKLLVQSHFFASLKTTSLNFSFSINFLWENLLQFHFSLLFSLLWHVCIDNCSAEFNNESGDEFMSKLKSTNTSYCQLRHNRNLAQRGTERSSSGASNQTYNFSSNSSAMQEKTTEPTTLTSSSAASSRNKMASDNGHVSHHETIMSLIILFAGIESTKVASFQPSQGFICYTS